MYHRPVRRLLLVLVVAAAGVALARTLRRRRPGGGPEPRVEPETDPRADELRRKLTESRAVVEEQEADAVAEIPVDRAEPGPPNVDERRRTVHERGGAVVERMRGRAAE